MNIDFPYTTTGYIKYDPPRHGMKRRTERWCVATIDREITRYYRSVIKTRFHLDLIPPSWDAHVSIFRGENIQGREHLWKKYDNKKIEIKYNSFVRQSGDTMPGPNSFFFIDVDCPFITEMRDEMGFPSNWKPHITIGKLPDNWDHKLYCSIAAR